MPGGDKMHPVVTKVLERRRAVDKATRGVPDRIRAILGAHRQWRHSPRVMSSTRRIAACPGSGLSATPLLRDPAQPDGGLNGHES